MYLLLCLCSVSMQCLRGGKFNGGLSESLTVTAAKTCTQLHDDARKKTVHVMRTCVAIQGGKFVEGVHGHITEVDSMVLKYCDRGDEATWYSFGVCCPGKLSY